jgi:hypothetical protein
VKKKPVEYKHTPVVYKKFDLGKQRFSKLKKKHSCQLFKKVFSKEIEERGILFGLLKIQEIKLLTKFSKNMSEETLIEANIISQNC